MTINVLISNFTDPQDGTVIGNIATADSDQHGPVTDNADVVVSAGKLLVTKETLVNAVQIGETIQYNVSVRNVGSDTLSNITFNDTLPLGQAFIQTGSTTGCTGASIAPTIVTCTVSNLTPGSSHDITILARKVIPGETDPTGVVGLTDPLHGIVDTNQACAFNNNVPQSCATSTVENVGAPNIILTKTGADTVVPARRSSTSSRSRTPATTQQWSARTRSTTALPITTNSPERQGATLVNRGSCVVTGPSTSTALCAGPAGPLGASASSSLVAVVLYGASYAGPDGLATLHVIDAGTGAATAIGLIGFERVSGMDFGPDGVLYATAERADGSDTPVLITIDPVTGAGTEVGPIGIPNTRGGPWPHVQSRWNALRLSATNRLALRPVDHD